MNMPLPQPQRKSSTVALARSGGCAGCNACTRWPRRKSALWMRSPENATIPLKNSKRQKQNDVSSMIVRCVAVAEQGDLEVVEHLYQLGAPWMQGHPRPLEQAEKRDGCLRTSEIQIVDPPVETRSVVQGQAQIQLHPLHNRAQALPVRRFPPTNALMHYVAAQRASQP